MRVEKRALSRLRRPRPTRAAAETATAAGVSVPTRAAPVSWATAATRATQAIRVKAARTRTRVAWGISATLAKAAQTPARVLTAVAVRPRPLFAATASKRAQRLAMTATTLL